MKLNILNKLIYNISKISYYNKTNNYFSFEDAKMNILYRLDCCYPDNKVKGLCVYKKLIINDLETSIRANMVYSSENDTKYNPNTIFPYMYVDDELNEIDIRAISQEKCFNLKETPTFVMPWNFSRLLKHFIRQDDFKYDYLNHHGYYLKHLGIAIIYNGYHSITEGILNRNRVDIVLDVIDDYEIYNNIETDGKYWYLKDGRKRIVSDYRIALVFWIQKEIIKEGD